MFRDRKSKEKLSENFKVKLICNFGKIISVLFTCCSEMRYNKHTTD